MQQKKRSGSSEKEILILRFPIWQSSPMMLHLAGVLAAAPAPHTATTLQAATGSSCPGRRVYLDLGVNWCNTLRLYDDLKDPRADALPEGWHVYGFEASALIQPFVEKCVQYMDGTADVMPNNCLPPAGSSHHLADYALAYGCPDEESDEMRECMWGKLSAPLAQLKPDPELNNTALVEGRLGTAATRCSTEGGRDKFTAIPAAVGGENSWLTLAGDSPQQLIRGGASGDFSATSNATIDQSATHIVPMIDFATWFANSFSPKDHIVLKIDVEGAEFAIFPKMIELGVMPWVHVLALECHGWVGDCDALRANVTAAAGSQMLIVEEGGKIGDFAYGGIDSHSAVPDMNEVRQGARACSIDVPATNVSSAYVHV